MGQVDQAIHDSYEAEQQVICSLMNDKSAIDLIADSLKPEMFTNAILAEAYRIIIEARENDEEIDYASICRDIKSRRDFKPKDVEDELIGTYQIAHNASAIEKHAEAIKKCYATRTIYKAFIDADSKGTDIVEVFQSVNDKILGITSTSKQCLSLADIAEQYSGEYFIEKHTKRLNTGIGCLDDIVGEFEGGDLIVIGARPAVGKSALAAQIVNNMAHDDNKIGYFNLEMTEKQLFERFVATESGIGLTRIRRAIKFLNDEQERYDAAVAKLKEKNNILISTGSKTVKQIVQVQKKENFDVVVVDYLQLAKPDRYTGNRYVDVGQISHALKALAVDYNIPVILLTQLNRVSEGKGNKEPTMAEIRESGDIEQDASIIFLLWNIDDDDRTRKGYKCDKNRQGTLKKGELKFDGDRMKFYGEDEDGFTETEAFNDFEIPFDL